MKRIKVKNFRKVNDPWELELGPITFFTGQNNSGKSSVLKALMVLNDYSKSNNHLELDFKGENKWGHKIDCYQNAVNWQGYQDGKRDIEFEFENEYFRTKLIYNPMFDNLQGNEKILKGFLQSITIEHIENSSRFKMYHLEGSKYQLNVDESFIEDGKSIISKIDNLKRTKLSNDEKIKALLNKYTNEQDKNKKIRLVDEINRLKKNQNNINSNLKKLSKDQTDKFDFNPLFDLKDLLDLDPLIDRILNVSLYKYFDKNRKNLGYVDKRSENFSLNNISEIVSGAFNISIEHLSPNRNTQTRLYINDEHTNDIYDLINRHTQNPIKKSGNADYFLKKWMKEFDIGVDFNIKPVEGIASMIHIYETEDAKKNEKPINLVDKGFGAGQVFTTLLAIALEINDLTTRKGISTIKKYTTTNLKRSILLIEEPETNLHPALQSKLADMIFYAYKEFGIRFIIETHSEYILRKSQLIVKEMNSNNENLDKLPFKVYYFDKKKGPYQMNYREDGAFLEEFGTGFFDESRKITRKLL